MKIQKKEVLDVLTLLSKKVNENFGDEIILSSQDYYWQIGLDDMYDVHQETKELMIGQISDDWSELKRLLVNADDAISYDLVRLGELLKLLKYSSLGVW
ncbi:hypothetical protein [Sphingobacterium hotanense]|uniref:hypothetical protein n=1 Tax=Sphingobacterium hotanense TaxID=649196 RepID=UPI0011F3E3A8|nr:hypothetical protein [Sphingobacterium hotanense]